MSKMPSSERQLGIPLTASMLLACALALAYFVLLGPNSAFIGSLAFFALIVLCFIVTFLAAGVLASVHSLHERLERLEQRDCDTESEKNS